MTARSTSRRLLFENDDDRGIYLDRLEEEAIEQGWLILHLCLMSTHVHLLLLTPEKNLGNGIRAAHGDFATHINGVRDEKGHLFGARFHNRLVLSEHHFAASMRYIANNPVAAGMCGRPEHWPWSGHRALCGMTPALPLVRVDAALELLGMDALGYADLVGQSDHQVLGRLSSETDGDRWMLTARLEYGVKVDQIAEFLGVHPVTVHRRIAAAKKGDSPLL